MTAPPKPLTEEGLAEIEARANAATAGPWVWQASMTCRSLLLRDVHHNTVLDFIRWGMGSAQARLNVGGIMRPLVDMLRTPQAHNAWHREGIDHPDAVFMENANVDVKRLIADLRATRAALEDVERWAIAAGYKGIAEKARAALPPEER